MVCGVWVENIVALVKTVTFGSGAPIPPAAVRRRPPYETAGGKD